MEWTNSEVATIKKRYKRFLADVVMPDGELLTVHVPNTGSMKSCWAPGDRVILSRSPNEKRKYSHTLEAVEREHTWVAINTAKTNALVEEALQKKAIPELKDFPVIEREIKVGNSRIDFLLSPTGTDAKPNRAYVEVKNVTLKVGDEAMFPDAVSTRAFKHLASLEKLKSLGHRAVIFFLIQRNDVVRFRAAEQIDPAYAKKLREVSSKGVEILCYQTRVDEEGVEVHHSFPFSLERV